MKKIECIMRDDRLKTTLDSLILAGAPGVTVTRVEGFGSQRDKSWFSEDAFLGLMRLRGIEASAPSGYAEAFYGRKILI